MPSAITLFRNELKAFVPPSSEYFFATVSTSLGELASDVTRRARFAACGCARACGGANATPILESRSIDESDPHGSAHEE
jgi:hypothetical protein